LLKFELALTKQFLSQSCFQIIKKFEISGHVFEKHSNIKFYENPSSEPQVVPCGQTDGQTDEYDKANSSFLQFSELGLQTFTTFRFIEENI
jgi:hypothetical protein